MTRPDTTRQASEERVSAMQKALGGAGVLAPGINSWSAAQAVLAHLDALALATPPAPSREPGLREALDALDWIEQAPDDAAHVLANVAKVRAAL